MTYRNGLTEIVSRSIVYLNNANLRIGTALLNRHGELMLNNGILAYTDRMTLSTLVAQALQSGATGVVDYAPARRGSLRFLALDSQHVFVLADNCADSGVINGFLALLSTLAAKVTRRN